jgi:hypothetical protein
MKYIRTLKANIKRGSASMSLVDILTNPPDPVFYTATIFAFISSIGLAWYACSVARCSDGMVAYYFSIYMIIIFSFLFVPMLLPSYALIIPVLFLIIHIITVAIHAIYAFYKYAIYPVYESEKIIEAVPVLGSLLVFLGVCVIIMGSYILNLPVSQAGNFPVAEYYKTNETVAPLVTTTTLTTTVTVTQSPITYTITSMVTRTEVVTSTVPESTLTITLRPLFSEDLVALAVAATMVIASIAIGLKLRKK